MSPTSPFAFLRALCAFALKGASQSERSRDYKVSLTQRREGRKEGGAVQTLGIARYESPRPTIGLSPFVHSPFTIYHSQNRTQTPSSESKKTVKALNRTIFILGSIALAILLAYAVIQFFPLSAE